jgi:hypothetical protein
MSPGRERARSRRGEGREMLRVTGGGKSETPLPFEYGSGEQPMNDYRLSRLLQRSLDTIESQSAELQVLRPKALAYDRLGSLLDERRGNTSRWRLTTARISAGGCACEIENAEQRLAAEKPSTARKTPGDALLRRDRLGDVRSGAAQAERSLHRSPKPRSGKRSRPATTKARTGLLDPTETRGGAGRRSRGETGGPGRIADRARPVEEGRSFAGLPFFLTPASARNMCARLGGNRNGQFRIRP